MGDVKALRAADAVSDDVYYYGLVTPSKSAQEYCSFGCLTSLTPPADLMADPAEHIAVGVQFVLPEVDQFFIDAFAHDIGRLHGRDDVSCQGSAASVTDHDYPGADGAIETWGWDVRTRTLLPPTAKDVLTFSCSASPNPHLIGASEYTYSALAERCVDVSRKR
jgi:hypothetical protein